MPLSPDSGTAEPAPAGDAGAPEEGIEVTPEMTQAGAAVVCAYFDGVIAFGSETAKATAKEVFLAMCRAGARKCEDVE